MQAWADYLDGPGSGSTRQGRIAPTLSGEGQLAELASRKRTEASGGSQA
jgi:hypothetical protein